MNSKPARHRIPTFSIILPTCNRYSMLTRAVHSVLQQTCGDFELIIIDDGSADNTAVAVANFSDPRIVYRQRSINGGAAAARNEGIGVARGRYVSFLDDDDEFFPDFLAETRKFLEKAGDDTGFAWSELLEVEDTDDGEVELEIRRWQPRAADPEQRFFTFLKSVCIGAGWGLTVKRKCFEVAGLFDESFVTGEDTDLLVRLSRHFDFVAIPEVLVKIHRHARPRLSASKPFKAAIYERMLERNFEILREQPNLLAYFTYKVGWWHYHAGERKRGRHFVLQALRINPWWFKPWLLLPVLEALGARGMRHCKKSRNHLNR